MKTETLDPLEGLSSGDRPRAPTTSASWTQICASCKPRSGVPEFTTEAITLRASPPPVRGDRAPCAPKQPHKMLDRPDLSWARRLVVVVTLLGLVAVACSSGDDANNASTTTVPGSDSAADRCADDTTGRNKIDVLPGMPPVTDPDNLYSEDAPDKVSSEAKLALPADLRAEPRHEHRVGDRSHDDAGGRHAGVRDQPAARRAVVGPQDAVGGQQRRGPHRRQPHADRPQDGEDRLAGAVRRPVDVYFTPDGESAIVVAEAFKRLDFRDPNTMALQSSLSVPDCAGVITPTSPSTASSPSSRASSRAAS